MKTLYYNGNIYTMKRSEDKVQAVLVENGIILGAGIYSDFRHEADELVDLEGATMLPGLTDTHMHLVMLGKKLKSLALNDVDDINMMKKLVSEFDSKDKWNVILGYDENNFPGQYKMKREELDMLIHKPTLITRVCHHAGLINTEAMSLLGLDRTTGDPEGGYFERDADGELTGWVYDKAFEMVREKTVEDDIDSISDDISTAVDHLHSYGITNVHTEDMSYHGPYQVPLGAYLKTVGPEGKKIRVNLLRHEQVYDEMVADGPDYRKDWIEPDAMKLFMDGAFGGKTALVKDPYEGTAEHGLQIHSQEDLESLIVKARCNKDAVAVHVIGDRACEMVVDAIEKHPVPEGKHDRLIHTSLLNQPLLERMAKTSIICDVQPTFLTSDMPWVEKYLGETRTAYLYPFKTMLDYGLMLGGSSDAPIETANPMQGIHTLVTRRGESGVYNESECISRYEAFKMYTHDAAAIIYKGDRAGLIDVGYYADFAIFERDVMQISSEELLTAKVIKTIVDGEVVYDGQL